MSGMKGILLLFVLFGAMYLGAQADSKWCTELRKMRMSIALKCAAFDVFLLPLLMFSVQFAAFAQSARFATGKIPRLTAALVLEPFHTGTIMGIATPG